MADRSSEMDAQQAEEDSGVADSRFDDVDSAAGDFATTKGASRKKKKGKKKALQFAFTSEQDILHGRYKFACDKPLPELDTLTAKAFIVEDAQNDTVNYYGLVCEQGLPQRTHDLRTIYEKKFEHANFLIPEALGVLQISTLKECRFVMIFKRPTGVKLSTLIAPKSNITEKIIIKDIMLPLTQIVHGLSDIRLSHGKIHPDNMWYDAKAKVKFTLGECFSEPCGYAQSYLYEPYERFDTMPLGKGDGDSTADYFAMGVLAVNLLLGFNPAQNLSREEYLEKCLANGLYNTIIGNREFSGMMEDLLKGLLADTRNERWGNPNMMKWLSGKKYNLLKPTPPREAPRPFTFEDTPFFNRRHLAHILNNNWNKAKVELRDKKVQRWVELSVQRPELATALGKIVEMTGGETGRLPTDDDDLVSKSLTMLDPYGPFRLQKLSCHIDGLGPLFADAMRNDNKQQIALLRRLIENDTVGTWSELFQTMPGYKSASVVWSFEQRRHAFQIKSIGFGTERILYDLNPTLPCLSPLVAKHHPRNITELLYSLNTIAAEKRHATTDPMDAHIAAFLCCRMNQFKEIKTDMDSQPQFKNKPQLKHLVILAQAQRKAEYPPLPKLTAWMAERIKPMIDTLHSRSLRKEMKEELDKSITKGNLTILYKLIANPEVIRQDMEGFKRAYARYHRNANKIGDLNKRGTLEERAIQVGSRIAFLLSFLVLILVTISLVNDYVVF